MCSSILASFKCSRYGNSIDFVGDSMKLGRWRVPDDMRGRRIDNGVKEAKLFVQMDVRCPKLVRLVSLTAERRFKVAHAGPDST